MDDGPQKTEPEIMPPLPDTEPQRSPEEVPQDKDAPQREIPERSGIGDSEGLVR